VIAIVALTSVAIIAAIGATFLYASRRSPGDRGWGLLAWTGIAGAIYFGILLFWTALLEGGLVSVHDPWFYVGLAGPPVVWSAVAVLAARARSGPRAAA
jgi:hypothetical protein